MTQPTEPKSKCCNRRVDVNTSTEGTSCYVCRNCDVACDVACEPLTEPTHWYCTACNTGNTGGYEGLTSHLEGCEKYQATKNQVPRLTPEQWAKVRWPSRDEIDDQLDRVRACSMRFGASLDHLYEQSVEWAISYALKDLKPEGEE